MFTPQACNSANKVMGVWHWLPLSGAWDWHLADHRLRGSESFEEGDPDGCLYGKYLAQVLQGCFQVVLCLLDTILPHLVQVIGWVRAVGVHGAKAQSGQEGAAVGCAPHWSKMDLTMCLACMIY